MVVIGIKVKRIASDRCIDMGNLYACPNNGQIMERGVGVVVDGRERERQIGINGGS